MAREVCSYICSCNTCQRSKPFVHVPAGFLQPLPILAYSWELGSLNFIVDLPKTTSGFDAILVVIDCLSKMAHFLPMHTKVTGP